MCMSMLKSIFTRVYVYYLLIIVPTIYIHNIINVILKISYFLNCVPLPPSVTSVKAS